MQAREEERERENYSSASAESEYSTIFIRLYSG